MAGNSANTGDTLVCDEHIGSETLSAWRDDLLPPAEMARIRTHAANCAACQASLSEFDAVAWALRQQREIEPDGRLLASLRLRAAQTSQGGRIHLPNSRVWRGLGALGSVAAVLLLAVYLLASGPGRFFTSSGGGTPTAKFTVAPTATATTVPGLSPDVSVTTAWGSHAASTSFTATLDATHIFVPGGITPDGRTLLGDEIPVSGGNIVQSPPAQAGMLDVATHRFTPIGVASNAPYLPSCCSTDGRFLIAGDSAAPGATCGICNARIWSYDLTNGKLWKVAIGGTYGGILGTNLSHGLLLLSTQGDGIQVVDLAAHTITPFRNSSIPSDSPAVVSAFAWPYVVYGTYPGSSSTVLLLRDLTTNSDLPLPAVENLYSSPNVSGSILLSGHTLFATVTVTNPNTRAVTYTTLYEVDYAYLPNAQPRAIAVFKGDLNSDPNGGSLPPLGASSRLTVFENAAWDRAEHRFVTLGATPIALTGDYLVTSTTSVTSAPFSTMPPTVTIYDTATLPFRIG